MHMTPWLVKKFNTEGNNYFITILLYNEDLINTTTTKLILHLQVTNHELHIDGG